MAKIYPRIHKVTYSPTVCPTNGDVVTVTIEGTGFNAGHEVDVVSHNPGYIWTRHENPKVGPTKLICEHKIEAYFTVEDKSEKLKETGPKAGPTDANTTVGAPGQGASAPFPVTYPHTEAT